MSLRITGGTLRGRIVESPHSADTRPTTDMWRSTIFDALSHLVDLEGAHVLDLFAGTGILGLEALSRGASHTTFVEKNPRLCKQLQATCKALLPNPANTTTIITDDVFHYVTLRLSDSQTIRLVFADPPYNLRCANQLITRLSRPSLKETGDYVTPHGNYVTLPSPLETGALLVVEHSPAEFILQHDGWETVWSKDKGDTAVDILRLI